MAASARPVKIVQFRNIRDAAVNHRHADSLAIQTQSLRVAAVDRCDRGVQRAANGPVGRNVGYVRIVCKSVKRFSRYGVMRGLDEVQLRLQDPALALHLLMVGSGRCLVELDDHVNGGAVMAAFESIEVRRKLVVLPVGKGQSCSQQRDQNQECKPCTPGGCLKDAVVRVSPCGVHKLSSQNCLEGPRGGQGPTPCVLSVLEVSGLD